MSIATMAAKTHAMTPEDDLIGSLTRERVSLLVRYTGGRKFPEDGYLPAKLWLAHMLDTEVPEQGYSDLIAAFVTATMMEDLDLELWYDIKATEANREQLQKQADEVATNCVEALATLLCTQLGVTA